MIEQRVLQSLAWQTAAARKSYLAVLEWLHANGL
jgi:hypothetical protein